jgi:anti-sigma28 factor (negative regulator of flagellin synthesis)
MSKINPKVSQHIQNESVKNKIQPNQTVKNQESKLNISHKHQPNSIKLSPEKKFHQTLLNKLKDQDKDREKLLVSIKKQIQEGTYNISNKKLAERIRLDLEIQKDLDDLNLF